MFPLVFLDIETTHLDPEIGEIIELCVIRDVGNKTTVFHTKIKPRHINTADRKALEINGYNEEDWKDAKHFEEIAEHLLYLVDHGIIIGHNVNFDITWINTQLHKHGFDRGCSYYKIDTQTLAWEHLPLPSVSMRVIRLFFGWSLKDSHTAHKDTMDCRKLYYKLRRATMLHRLWWRLKFKYFWIY